MYKEEKRDRQGRKALKSSYKIEGSGFKRRREKRKNKQRQINRHSRATNSSTLHFTQEREAAHRKRRTATAEDVYNTKRKEDTG